MLCETGPRCSIFIERPHPCSSKSYTRASTSTDFCLCVVSENQLTICNGDLHSGFLSISNWTGSKMCLVYKQHTCAFETAARLRAFWIADYFESFQLWFKIIQIFYRKDIPTTGIQPAGKKGCVTLTVCHPSAAVSHVYAINRFKCVVPTVCNCNLHTARGGCYCCRLLSGFHDTFDAVKAVHVSK